MYVNERNKKKYVLLNYKSVLVSSVYTDGPQVCGKSRLRCQIVPFPPSAFVICIIVLFFSWGNFISKSLLCNGMNSIEKQNATWINTFMLQWKHLNT